MAVCVGELFQYVRKPRDRIAVERDILERLVRETNQQCMPTTWSAVCGCLLQRSLANLPADAFYFHLRAIHILKLYPPWARIYWRYRLLKYVKQ